MKKRLIMLFMATAVVFSLSGCKKSPEVEAVETQIESFGEVNEESGEKIKEIEDAYNALEQKEQKHVKNYKKFVKYEEEYNKLLADKVVKLIDKIDTSDVEKGSKDIKKAAEEYEKLTDEQKEFVTNYETLENAEDALMKLRVEEVEKLIAAAVKDSNDESVMVYDSVKKAKDAYKQIDDEHKKDVKSYSKLEQADEKITARLVKNAQSIIDNALANESEENYKAAENAYNSLHSEARSQIKNYDLVSDGYEEFKAKSPIKLNSCHISKNSYSNYADFYINAVNESGKDVREFSLVAFIYDGDGLPVKVQFGYDDYLSLRYSQSLKAGGSTSGNVYWSTYGDYYDMKYAVVFVNSIDYFDGTTWTNPNIGKYMTKYENQKLDLNDKHILNK